MSADVLEFLASVHAADEQAARAAENAKTERGLRAASPWIAAGSLLVAAQLDDSHEEVAEVADYQLDAVVGHAARHDPQSVLARVQAERALVAMHEPVDLPPGPYGIPANTFCRACADGGMPVQDERGTGWALWPCPSLRVLAWGYRGREGFDPAWAPDGVEVGA